MLKTAADIAEEKKRSEEEKEQQQQAARQRKARMIQLEEERKKRQPLSDMEIEERQTKNAILEAAMEKLIEGHDDVKDMNKMMLYSKCVAIRDKQLEEKARNVFWGG